MSALFQKSLGAVLSGEACILYGRVKAVEGMSLKISGLKGISRLGDRIELRDDHGDARHAEIIALEGEDTIAYAYGKLAGVHVGQKAFLDSGQSLIAPSDDWRGKVLDAFGRMEDEIPAVVGPIKMPLEAQPPVATRRKKLGRRLNTGLCVFDTFLPICEGQRIGLFAGSGVGKSMLLGDLACSVEADIAVIALIGERGREVRAFVEDILGAKGMENAVVIASTSDQPALVKKRAAQLAMTTAEFFRNQGQRVLFLFDSLTRYADAHREVALAAGEPPSLHAYPPSTFSAIASLVERAGPGEEGNGDITAIFSVLVAGSDMDEPVADIVRGVLDGHVILERSIAERGRFPAVDVRRSVSRSLPMAASAAENASLAKAREILGVYEEAETIVRAGLYVSGTDPKVDAALKIWPGLDQFVAAKNPGGAVASFADLDEILSSDPQGAPHRVSENLV